MQYVYMAGWFLAAVLSFVKYRKLHKIMYAVSAYFLFMGCWWLADIILEADLMSGGYAWVVRGVSGAMIAAGVIVYLCSKRRTGTSEQPPKKIGIRGGHSSDEK